MKKCNRCFKQFCDGLKECKQCGKEMNCTESDDICDGCEDEDQTRYEGQLY
jgi:hypothetical protein